MWTGLATPGPLCSVPRGRDRPGRLTNWNVLATHWRLGSSFRAILNRSADCWFHITHRKKKSIVAGRAGFYSLQADINALQRRVWYLSFVIFSQQISLNCKIHLNCWDWALTLLVKSFQRMFRFRATFARLTRSSPCSTFSLSLKTFLVFLFAWFHLREKLLTSEGALLWKRGSWALKIFRFSEGWIFWCLPKASAWLYTACSGCFWQLTGQELAISTYLIEKIYLPNIVQFYRNHCFGQSVHFGPLLNLAEYL